MFIYCRWNSTVHKADTEPLKCMNYSLNKYKTYLKMLQVRVIDLNERRWDSSVRLSAG
jgi:hypothetical protein